MTPAKQAKALGAKSLVEVAKAYDLSESAIVKIHRTNPDRFEIMVKVHVMAKQIEVSTQHLNFMLESVVSKMQRTNAADYFVNDGRDCIELTRAHVVDFRIHMNYMCQQLLLNEQAKSDFREAIYTLLTKD